MGKPGSSHVELPASECIGGVGVCGEVKHLSTYCEDIP